MSECPNCKTTYEGNFCPSCGTARVLPPNEKGDGVVVGDLLQCVYMFGKTPEQVGITEDKFTGSRAMRQVILDGELFGGPEYGQIILFGSEEVIRSLWIHVAGKDMMRCVQELTKAFGPAIEQGEEPYAAVNGGAVTWFDFDSPLAEIRFSNASAKTYMSIDMKWKN